MNRIAQFQLPKFLLFLLFICACFNTVVADDGKVVDGGEFNARKQFSADRKGQPGGILIGRQGNDTKPSSTESHYIRLEFGKADVEALAVFMERLFRGQDIRFAENAEKGHLYIRGNPTLVKEADELIKFVSQTGAFDSPPPRRPTADESQVQSELDMQVLRAKHEESEQEVAAISDAYRLELQRNSPNKWQLVHFKDRLTTSVENLFDVRQRLQELEVLKYRQRLQLVEDRIRRRELLKDKIIAARVDELITGEAQTQSTQGGRADKQRETSGTVDSFGQSDAPQTIRQVDGPPTTGNLANTGPQVPAQVILKKPIKANATWASNEGTPQKNLVLPSRTEILTGSETAFSLTEIPQYVGVELTVSIEMAPVCPESKSYLAHNAVPFEIMTEDIEQAVGGHLVTKIVFLPDREYAKLALAGVESLVSTRLDPGVDALAEADRRGTVVATLRIGNRARSTDIPSPRGQTGSPLFEAPVPKITGVDGDYVEIWGGSNHGFEEGDTLYVYRGSTTKDPPVGTVMVFEAKQDSCVAKTSDGAGPFNVGDHVYWSRQDTFKATVPAITGIDGAYIEIDGVTDYDTGDDFEVGDNLFVYGKKNVDNVPIGQARIVRLSESRTVAKMWEISKAPEIGDRVYTTLQTADGPSPRARDERQLNRLEADRRNVLAKIADTNRELSGLAKGDHAPDAETANKLRDKLHGLQVDLKQLENEVSKLKHRVGDSARQGCCVSFETTLFQTQDGRRTKMGEWKTQTVPGAVAEMSTQSKDGAGFVVVLKPTLVNAGAESSSGKLGRKDGVFELHDASRLHAKESKNEP